MSVDAKAAARPANVMGALELLLDVAWDEPDCIGRPPRTLGIVARAFDLEGLAPMGPTRPISHDEMLERLEQAQKHRDRKKLDAAARGLLTAVRILVDAGVLTYANTAEARRKRWLERGGHSQ